IASALTSTSEPSLVLGPGHYAARYSFNVHRGDAIRFTVTSQDFDSYLTLTDPNRVVVVQDDDSLLFGLRPAIYYSFRTNGIYVFELTSASPGATGNFSFSIDCYKTPELDVTYSGTNFLTNATIDFRLTN